MPINVNDLYNRIVYLVNDAQQGRIAPLKVSPLINVAQNNYYKELVEQYNGTKQLSNYLLPFQRTEQLSIPVNGDVPYPSGFPTDYDIYTSVRIRLAIPKDNNQEINRALRCGAIFKETQTIAKKVYNIYENEVVEILPNKREGRLQSAMLKPNLYNPIFTMYGNVVKFYPINIGTVTLDYIKLPQQAIWNYTTQNGIPVYNPTGSVDLEWDVILLDEIATRAVQAYLSNVMQYQKTQ